MQWNWKGMKKRKTYIVVLVWSPNYIGNWDNMYVRTYGCIRGMWGIYLLCIDSEFSPGLSIHFIVFPSVYVAGLKPEFQLKAISMENNNNRNGIVRNENEGELGFLCNKRKIKKNTS